MKTNANLPMRRGRKKKIVPGEVKILNLRNFPISLYWGLKLTSVRKRISMKDYIVQVLGDAVEKEEKKYKRKKVKR